MWKKGFDKKQFILGMMIIPIGAYGIMWFLYLVAMSFENYTELGISSWMQAATTLFGTFFGPFAAVQGSLWINEKNKNRKLNENMEYSEKIIKLFLIHEIKHNFEKALGGKKTFYERMSNETKPTQFGYDRENIRLDEFNKVKYELIKYDNEIVHDIIELYYMFETLKGKRDINQFSQEEFQDIKDTYLKNLPKYFK